MEIRVPAAADLRCVGQMLSDIRSIDPDADVEFDFRDVRFTPPSWLAAVGGALRQLKFDRPKVKRKAINFRHLHYAAYVGFFEYFGLRFGQRPDAAPGSDTYVPLSVRQVCDVRRSAAELSVPVGEFIHSEAERLATILTRQVTGNLQDVLAYSIREIARNSVEHSCATEYTFAAQYWPSKNAVEVVLSDQGRGLADSLRDNPRLQLENDKEALSLAVLPGISSKAWRERRHYDEWANSGYGLFMTERLCRLGGSFELMSGDCLLQVNHGASRFSSTHWPGTLVVLRLDTRQLGSLTDHLRSFRSEGLKIERLNTGKAKGPSRASENAKPKSWNAKP